MNSPSHSGRLGALLEGLDVSVVNSRTLKEHSRLDSQFFRRAYLAEDHALHSHPVRTVGELAFVTDGPHGYHEVDDNSPIAMLTAKCAGDWFADRENADTIAGWVDAANKRSSLQVNDLILSTRGTIGNCAVVTREALPANLDQDLARIALREDGPVSPSFLLAYLNSRFGQDHIVRHSSGMVQQGLSLAAVRAIPIPVLSTNFQGRLSAVVERALRLRREGVDTQLAAEDVLLRSLGLADWQPPEPLSYTARATDARAAARLDAEHFQPRFASALSHVSAAGVKTASLRTLIEPIFNGIDMREFVAEGTPYIRVGDIRGGRVELGRVKRVSATITEVKHNIVLRDGDVLFTRKGSFGNAAVVAAESRDCIISTEIMLLRLRGHVPRQVRPEYLAAFFNSGLGQLQAERWAHGVAFYSVTQSDLYRFEVPMVDVGVQDHVAEMLDAASRFRDQSKRSLRTARRAVEIAIQEGEPSAVTLLERAGEGAS